MENYGCNKPTLNYGDYHWEIVTTVGRRLIWCTMNRQTIRCHPRSLARQVRRTSPHPPQERRSKCRYQGLGHKQPDHQAHPSQPGTEAAPSYIPCSWSCKFPRPFNPYPKAIEHYPLYLLEAFEEIVLIETNRLIPTCPTPATSK